MIGEYECDSKSHTMEYSASLAVSFIGLVTVRFWRGVRGTPQTTFVRCYECLIMSKMTSFSLPRSCCVFACIYFDFVNLFSLDV